jgi:hypothetical protein
VSTAFATDFNPLLAFTIKKPAAIILLRPASDCTARVKPHTVNVYVTLSRIHELDAGTQAALGCGQRRGFQVFSTLSILQVQLGEWHGYLLLSRMNTISHRNLLLFISYNRVFGHSTMASRSQ